MNTNNSDKGAVDRRTHHNIGKATEKKANETSNKADKARLTDLAKQHYDIAKGKNPS